MPSQHTTKREPVSPKKKKKKNRPVMRFQFGFVICIWLVCIIGSFAIYMVHRNLHPELDAQYRKNTSSAESSDEEPDTPESSIAEESSVSAEDSQTDESDPEESSQLVIANKINPVPESAAKTTDYLTKAAFLGDANVYLFKENALLGSDNVYSSMALNLDNYETEYFDYNGTQLRMLSIMRAASCPIYLMFGTESLAEKSPTETSALFSDMLNKVKAVAPEADIFVLSVPPVTYDAERGEKPIQNSAIDEYNSLLLEIANESDVYFVDTNTALKNNDGKLDYNLAQEDGVHLSAEGGAVLLNYVLAHVPQ